MKGSWKSKMENDGGIKILICLVCFLYLEASVEKYECKILWFKQQILIKI